MYKHFIVSSPEHSLLFASIVLEDVLEYARKDERLDKVTISEVNPSKPNRILYNGERKGKNMQFIYESIRSS